MARILLFVYSFLIFFVHYGSSTTMSATPSPTTVAAGLASTVPTPSVNVVPSTSVPTGPLGTKTFEAKITVNETYKSNYNDNSSAEFQNFITDFETKVKKFFQTRLSGFKRVVVKKLSNGSVVVDFVIEVQKSSNATEKIITDVLQASNSAQLGYTILGNVTVKLISEPLTPSVSSAVTVPTPSVNVVPSTSVPTVSPSPSANVSKSTPATPTSSTKGTEIWDKAIDYVTPMGTFIIVVVAVALILILLIALICICCKYRSLKKKTHFPDHMAINDSEWIRSNDDLLMWERNLRASEVKTTNGVSNRPINDKRT